MKRILEMVHVAVDRQVSHSNYRFWCISFHYMAEQTIIPDQPKVEGSIPELVGLRAEQDKDYEIGELALQEHLETRMEQEAPSGKALQSRSSTTSPEGLRFKTKKWMFHGR